MRPASGHKGSYSQTWSEIPSSSSFPLFLVNALKSDRNGAFGFLNSAYGTEKSGSGVGSATAAPRRPPQQVPGESSARPRAGKGARGEARDFERLARALLVQAFPGRSPGLGSDTHPGGVKFS